MKHGFLLVDKPEGPTSHDIVAKVRRVLQERKMGHLGTLDPFASGLMVLAVGAKALKVVEFFGDLPKQYEAVVRLGARSSTYDRDGVIEQTDLKPGWSIPSLIDIRMVIENGFVGDIVQVPPAHSAVHIDGRRAYELARAGEEVRMPSRTVRITDCTVTAYEYPLLTLRISCGSGTYIRSLAHDLGAKLRCGGYLEGLRRTKVGEWSVEFAVTPEESGWSYVMPLFEVMEPFPSVEVNDKEYEHMKCGRDFGCHLLRETIAWNNGLPVGVLAPSHTNPSQAHARKVF